MEFDVNNLIEKAKETVEVVAKATKKTASVQKKKFDVATIQNRLDKAYKLLGKTYFESLECDEENFAVEAAVQNVKVSIAELEEAKNQLEAEKES